MYMLAYVCAGVNANILFFYFCMIYCKCNLFIYVCVHVRLCMCYSANTDIILLYSFNNCTLKAQG